MDAIVMIVKRDVVANHGPIAAVGNINTVLVEGIITPDGKVTNIKVIRGVEPELDKIAIDAFRRFQFQGATLNDKPAFASWREEIAFKVPGQ